MNVALTRLQDAMEAARRAAVRLESSLTHDRADLSRALAQDTDGLDRDALRVLDSFVQRFQQTHEHLTRRVFPALYRLEEAGSRPPPLAQLLDWLEGLALVPHASYWLEIAETRNRLVHEYPLTAAERTAELTDALDQSRAMLETIDRLIGFLDTRSTPESDHDRS